MSNDRAQRIAELKERLGARYQTHPENIFGKVRERLRKHYTAEMDSEDLHRTVSGGLCAVSGFISMAGAGIHKAFDVANSVRDMNGPEYVFYACGAALLIASMTRLLEPGDKWKELAEKRERLDYVSPAL